MTYEEKIQAAKEIDIVSYLKTRGISNRSTGGKHFVSSPFSKDSNWSFCIYPSNTYFDWSTGYYGDVINLVQKLEGLEFAEAVDHLLTSNFTPIKLNYNKYKASERDVEFDYTKYLNYNKKEQQVIDDYALSRAIYDGYEYGVFFTRVDNKWVRNPSLMFVHRDINLKICGAKFRKVNNFQIKDGSNNERFSARGNIGFYILENIIQDSFEEPVLYLVESETSANSLWQHFVDTNRNCVVISFGGVSSAPSKIPAKYSKFKLKIIIDYDGNEELYNKRLNLYAHLNGEAVKLILPKAEDMNSLYASNKINLIQNLI